MKGHSLTKMWQTILLYRIFQHSCTQNSFYVNYHLQIVKVSYSCNGNARVQVIAFLAVTRRSVPLQTSPFRCLLWCFRRNFVKKSSFTTFWSLMSANPLSRVLISATVCLSNFITDCHLRTRVNHSAEPSK